jgi:hypothetical protein
MKNLCGAGDQATTALQVIDGMAPLFDGGVGIHAWLNADPPLDPLDPGVSPPWIGHWWLMSGVPYAGECDEQANFMKLAVKLIGGPGGIRYETYPTPDPLRGVGGNPCDPSVPIIATAAQAGITWDIDGNGTIGEEQLILRFDFAGGAGTSINAFEGSVEYPEYPMLGKVYAVWPSLVASSRCGMLQALSNMQPIRAVQCWAMQANPWECIRNRTTGVIDPEPFPDCTGCGP